MLAFDTGPGRGGHRRRRAPGRSPALVRPRRPDRRPGDAGRDRARRAAGRSVLLGAAAQEHRPRALRRRATPRRCTRACPAPTASPPRSSSPRGASRRPSAGWTPRRHRGGRLRRRLPPSRGSWRRSSGISRPPAATRSGGSSELFFPGDAKEAVAFALLGLSHAPRAARQRPRRDRRERRPRPRHGHARMSTASAAPDPGRLILPALRAAADGGFGHEAARIADALDLGVGGFIVFGGTVESVRRLTADLLRRAGRPLLIASDLERGAGQQVAGLTEFPPPLALASLEDAAVVRWAGAVTAQEARAVGINWVFAPVGDLDVLADNPIVQTRAFGDDPNRVASLVRTWIEGCQDAGALACAKHFPGHGRTTVDSHIALPVVSDTRGHAARQRSAAVRHRGRERSGVDDDGARGLPRARRLGRAGHDLRPDHGRAARAARVRRAGRDRRADHGRRAGGPARIGRGGRGGAGRRGPAALPQRRAPGARRARAGARERHARARAAGGGAAAATSARSRWPPARRRR